MGTANELSSLWIEKSNRSREDYVPVESNRLPCKLFLKSELSTRLAVVTEDSAPI
jgi:hypothetical protein